MDKRTRKALEGSIRKWQAIVEWKGEDKGSDNCPLCARFLTRDCHGCPVSVRTGMGACLGTPFAAFRRGFILDAELVDAWICDSDTQIKFVVIGPESQAAAEAELAFLISLRED